MVEWVVTQALTAMAVHLNLTLVMLYSGENNFMAIFQLGGAVCFFTACLYFGLDQGSSTFVFSFTPWKISKVKFTPKTIFIFSLLLMPIVIGKSVNFLKTKFIAKTGQIYPRLTTPGLDKG